MGCNAGEDNKKSTLEGIFIMILSLEGWKTKSKKVPSLLETKLTPLDTNPVFQCLRDSLLGIEVIYYYTLSVKVLLSIRKEASRAYPLNLYL